MIQHAMNFRSHSSGFKFPAEPTIYFANTRALPVEVENTTMHHAKAQAKRIVGRGKILVTLEFAQPLVS